MATFEQIVVLVAERLQDLDHITWSEDAKKRHINDSYRRLQRLLLLRTEWRIIRTAQDDDEEDTLDAIVVTAGQNEYNLPADFLRARRVLWSQVSASTPLVVITSTAKTPGNPVTVTATAHGFDTGDHCYITGVAGMTQLNLHYYQVTRVDANSFTLDNTAAGTYTSPGAGGTAAPCSYSVSSELTYDNAHATVLGTAAQGTPSQYFVRGSYYIVNDTAVYPKLYVKPTPNMAAEFSYLVVEYLPVPVELSGDTDVSTLPDDFVEAVVLSAVAKCWAERGQASMAGLYSGMAQSLAQELFETTFRRVAYDAAAPGYSGSLEAAGKR